MAKYCHCVIALILDFFHTFLALKMQKNKLTMYFKILLVIFLENMLYLGSSTADGGDKGIKGEFSANGFDNKIPMKKGVVCLDRGEDYNSGYGRFFVLTKNNSKLSGQYAAFGKITDMDALEDLLDDCNIYATGVISESPKITSVSLHAAHH